MIESVTLYNMVLLQSVTIDKKDSLFVLNEVDFGTVEGTHNSFKFINQVGEYIDSTTLESRSISISGWVIGETESIIEQNRKTLNRLINPVHDIQLQVYDKYYLIFKPTSSIKYSRKYKENNEVLCKFIINGIASDPMFSLLSSLHKEANLVTPLFKFPLIIPASEGVVFGKKAQSLIVSFMNDGDIDTGMNITLTALSTVENPVILNIQTREQLKINKTLTSGEVIEISTEHGRRYVKGRLNGVESNYFGYFDIDSDWIQIHTGENNFQYNADSGVENLTVEIKFSPRYLEVE